jgi:hypothetical protein
MSAEGEPLPTLVGYWTRVLPGDGVQLDLQVALSVPNEPDRKFHRISLAMDRSNAKELGEALLATVKLMEEGPTPLQ